MWDNALKRLPHKMSRGQIILKICPFCSNDRFNLEVSVEKGIYHCWICDSAGRVWKLFKELGLPFEDDGLQISQGQQPVKKLDELSLDTFHPVLWDTYDGISCRQFLESRGLGKEDVERYRILTTDKGKFRNQVIFPLYEGSKLVYIVARDTRKRGRYSNINVNRSAILPYYLGKVDKATVYLCEGIMDAISINKLGYSAAVLLGTVLSEAQLRKIDAFGFKTVVACLDGDALVKSIKIYDMAIKHGLPALVTRFDKADDPNSVFVRDRAELKYIINHSVEVTLKDRVCLKIKS